jgi:hypothetical protein
MKGVHFQKWRRNPDRNIDFTPRKPPHYSCAFSTDYAQKKVYYLGNM